MRHRREGEGPLHGDLRILVADRLVVRKKDAEEARKESCAYLGAVAER